MNYPSRVDLAVMKSRGDDPEAIREAERRAAESPALQELCLQIVKAFAGVTLGKGVGLREGQAIDDYADEATRAAYRKEDEKADWRRISSPRLNGWSSSLSFFDAEGMRFHLPAFLIGELLGTYRCGLVFYLTHGMTMDHNRSKFALLSGDQRRVVRAFLLYAAEDSNYDYYRPAILKALEEYWTDPK